MNAGHFVRDNGRLPPKSSFEKNCPEDGLGPLHEALAGFWNALALLTQKFVDLLVFNSCVVGIIAGRHDDLVEDSLSLK